MDIFELMDSKYKAYTNTDSYIYDRCRKNPEIFAQYHINDLTQSFNFSQASLTRFAKKLGFSGFNEFQYQLAQDLHTKNDRKEAHSNAEVYGKVLKAVEESLDDEEMSSLAEKILKAGFVYLAGGSFSELPAQYIHMALNFAHLVRSEVMDFNHSYFTPEKDDLVIVFSVAGGFTQTGDHAFIESAGHSVLVTMNPKHPVRKQFSEVIVLPDVKAAYGRQLVSSDTMSFLMFCDILVSNLEKMVKEA